MAGIAKPWKATFTSLRGNISKARLVLNEQKNSASIRTGISQNDKWPGLSEMIILFGSHLKKLSQLC